LLRGELPPAGRTGRRAFEHWCFDDEHQHSERHAFSFARDASVGGSQYTSLLQKELGLSFEQAEGVKRGAPLPEGIEPRPIQPIIEAVSDTLALEVRKTMDFYRATAEQDSDGGIQKILLAEAVRSFRPG
jgi:Tfp pilus assembly PilM family ATPase